MANTSEEFVNSTLDFLFSLTIADCLKENQDGLLLYYLIAALCFFLGTPAHLWCFWFYFGTEQKIKSTQVFLFHYTIMEIIFCLECGIEALNIFVFNNDILWYVLYFIGGVSWTGRPLFQTCICIEQYLAVIHPVTFRRYNAIKDRISAVVAAWLMAIAYGGYEINATVFPDLIYTFVFFIAIAVISFCCVSVLCVLKHPGPGDKHITKQTGRVVGNQQKRKAFKTIFSALLLILFTYLPQVVLIIFTETRINQALLECTIVPFITSLNVFGVIITPFLKLYKESHKQCLKHQKEIQVTA